MQELISREADKLTHTLLELKDETFEIEQELCLLQREASYRSVDLKALEAYQNHLIILRNAELHVLTRLALATARAMVIVTLPRRGKKPGRDLHVLPASSNIPVRIIHHSGTTILLSAILIERTYFARVIIAAKGSPTQLRYLPIDNEAHVFHLGSLVPCRSEHVALDWAWKQPGKTYTHRFTDETSHRYVFMPRSN